LYLSASLALVDFIAKGEFQGALNTRGKGVINRIDQPEQAVIRDPSPDEHPLSCWIRHKAQDKVAYFYSA
jgi:hypothetical protein